MYNLMVIGLLGEEAFAQLLIGMPDEFFGMHRTDQDALWKAVLAKINSGVRDTQNLTLFAGEWLRLYQFFGMPQIQV